MTLADLSWTPLSRESVEEVAERVAERWDHPAWEPEVWAFGTVHHRPRSELRSVHFELAGDFVVVRVQLPEHATSRVGRTGPYLVWAIASVPKKNEAIRFDRAVQQAILSPECPVPVESQHEREAARVLHRLGMRFHKPMLDVQPGLRPDFLVLRQRILLEVQGLETEEYLRRKADMHERLRVAPAYQNWCLIRYDANAGEGEKDLRVKLKNWWRLGARS